MIIAIMCRLHLRAETVVAIAARAGGFGLAFKADALWVGTRVEGVNGSPAAEPDAERRGQRVSRAGHIGLVNVR